MQAPGLIGRNALRCNGKKQPNVFLGPRCSLVSLDIVTNIHLGAQEHHDTLEVRLEEMEFLVEQTRSDEATAAAQAEATKHAIKNAQV